MIVASERHRHIINNQSYCNESSLGIFSIIRVILYSLRSNGGGMNNGLYGMTPGGNQNVRLSMSPYTGFVGKTSTKEDESKLQSCSLR